MTAPTPDSAPDLWPTLIDHLSDGVLVIDCDGAIRIANPALCRLFDLERDAVAGQDFGTLFVLADGLDEFTAAVLDAVAAGGAVETRLVQVRTAAGESRALTVTAAPLPATAARPGAVIVTLKDLTEIRELRETELQLAGQVKSQLGELQRAYRDLEARSREMTSLTRRNRAARWGAVGLAAALFVGIGGWGLQSLDQVPALPDWRGAGDTTDAARPESGAGGDMANLRTLTVTPTVIETTRALRGRLGFGRVAEIVSPFEGNLRAVHVSPGTEVTAGTPLLTLETSALTTTLRRAEVTAIRAREKLTTLENWATSDEMARARAARRRAGAALEEATEAADRAAFLFAEGIIAAQEYDQARRSRDNRRLDDDAAARDLAAVERQASAETLRIARIEADTADAQVQLHRDQLDQATVTAPLTGVLIADAGPGSKPLVPGRPVTAGERLASVADLAQLAVVSRIEEGDVRQIKVGQPARITGPGFPGLEINGTVTRVAAQAAGGSARSAPQFPITVDLDRLDPSARARLRVGMSAYVTIITDQTPDALLVPLAALQPTAPPTLRIRDPATGTITPRPVTVGRTTLDSVVITRGLSAGETVVLP